jgi:HD-GYP domain-containing protein (c-di-GMP phosphodiesterase class II)
MLRYIGCTAGAHVVADIMGDEIAASSWFMPIAQGEPPEAMAALVGNVGADLPLWRRLAALAHAMAALPALAREGQAAHCEVASNLTARLGLGQSLRSSLPAFMERWDGKGTPGRLAADRIPRTIRAANLAQDLAVFLRLGGPEAALATARKRAGHAHDPGLVDTVVRTPDLLSDLEDGVSWELAIDSEPPPRLTLGPRQLDTALQAIADFVDLKSPYLGGHSRAVACLAGQAAAGLGLSRGERVEVERAGLVHDLGRVAITAAIWHKPGKLTEDEWERVRLHAYQTERILARPQALERLGALGSLHHERLDGSGYHRRAQAAHLSPPARLLAAADAFQAMREDRPHRPALGSAAAADALRQQGRLCRLDPQCVEAVLEAAGHPATAQRRSWPANLTDREVEVLRLAARGLTDREMAERLSVSRKTVSHHIEHIYDKLGVSTRPGLALFAMEHDLLR